MPVYDYVALDPRGRRVTGTVDAPSPAQARARLRSQGTYAVSIDESAGQGHPYGQGLWRRRLAPRELTAMTRQLATLLEAGVPLVEALDALLQQNPGRALGGLIAAIRAEINQGATFSGALATQGELLPPLYINMVRAGEASGNLDLVLQRLALFRERQEELQGRFRAALAYPLFMAVFGTAVLVFLLLFVVPGISDIFRESATVLPLPTRLLLAGSEFLRHWWWAPLLLLAGSVWAWRRFTAQGAGRRLRDALLLRLPVIGPLLHKMMLARFATTLASLLHSGVGLLPALAIVRALLDNALVAEVLDRAMARVTEGGGVAVALADSSWFPPALRQMIAVGERSGNLEGMLEKSGLFYEREAETALNALTALLEPALIAIMGLAVGFVVLSILLPIFEMNQMLGGTGLAGTFAPGMPA